MADVALGLADIPWRDGLIAWLVPSVLPTDKVDRAVLALLGSALPTWGGMGPGPAEHPGLRVARDGDSAAPEGTERVDDPGTPDGGAIRWADGDPLSVERDDLLHRLLALCRSVPDECPEEAAAVCTVAAHVAWVGGDGAIARAAVERALRLAPDYRLAQLLARLVEIGLRLPPVTGETERPGALGEVG